MNAFKKHAQTAFTLVELLVAISIIAVLIGLLIPTFSAVTNNANNVATQTRLAVLDRGLESYRGEQALGGTYPPSQSDNSGPATVPITIADPLDPNGTPTSTTGANLLVYALNGADGLGTPGFRDLDNDGKWWNDQHSTPMDGGAYELDQNTLEPVQPRYPGSGGSYVDEPTRAGIRTLKQLVVDAEIPGPLPAGIANSGAEHQPFFSDAWNHPILYYKANRAASLMIRSPDVLGVYDPIDNALLTGSSENVFQGVDFGAGQHAIRNTQYPPAIPDADGNGVHDVLEFPDYENSLARFILDPSIKQRNEPVNRDSYLLISAGVDAIYGTSDDITNWTRE